LPRTNTLTYYEKSVNYVRKSFIVQAPGFPYDRHKNFIAQAAENPVCLLAATASHSQVILKFEVSLLAETANVRLASIFLPVATMLA
jgi:hypothetical protein